MDPRLIADIKEIKRRLERLESNEQLLTARGTFTPAFAGTGTAGTFTYVANGQKGAYARNGNQVTIHIYVQISAISVAPTGNMRITGLPFTAASVGMDFSMAIGFPSNINVSATAIQLCAIIPLGGTTIDLYEMFDNAAAAAFPAANFGNANAAIELSGTYQIA